MKQTILFTAILFLTLVVGCVGGGLIERFAQHGPWVKPGENRGQAVEGTVQSFAAEHPAVVKIVGGCTAVCVSESGLIMTARHCGTAESVTVQFGSRQVEAKRVYIGQGTGDAPVVYDCDGDGYPFVEVGAQVPKVGDDVFCVGFPGRDVENRVVMRGKLTGGTVLANGMRANTTDFQTMHGMSGCPLFNASGEVIGLLNGGDPSRSFYISFAATRAAYDAVARGKTGGNGECADCQQVQIEIDLGKEAVSTGEPDVDWAGVTIVVLAAEQDVGTARGMARRMALERMSGPLRRRFAEMTQHKARLELVSERLSPVRFEAVCDAAGIGVDKFFVLVLVKKQTSGIKGLMVRKVAAAKEEAILEKLKDAPVDVVLGGLHPQDYARVIAALAEEKEPGVFRREDAVQDAARDGHLLEIAEGIKRQDALVVKQQGMLLNRVEQAMAAISKRPKPTDDSDKIPYRDEGLLGGLAMLISERGWRRGREWWANRKLRKEQAA